MDLTKTVIIALICLLGVESQTIQELCRTGNFQPNNKLALCGPNFVRSAQQLRFLQRLFNFQRISQKLLKTKQIFGFVRPRLEPMSPARALQLGQSPENFGLKPPQMSPPRVAPSIPLQMPKVNSTSRQNTTQNAVAVKSPKWFGMPSTSRSISTLSKKQSKGISRPRKRHKQPISSTKKPVKKQYDVVVGEQDWKPFNSENEKIMKQGNVHIKTTKRKGSSPDLTTAKPKTKDINKTVPQRRDSERIANIQSYVEALKLRSVAAGQFRKSEATSSGHTLKLTSDGDHLKPIAPPSSDHLRTSVPPRGDLKTTAPPFGSYLKTKAPPGADPPKLTAPPSVNSKTATPGVGNPNLTWASQPSFTKTAVASFSCQDKEAGFYADTELGCQVI